MDFGAQNTFKSYQEIPTGALRPRNDILGSAVRLNDKLKFNHRKTKKSRPVGGSRYLYRSSSGIKSRVMERSWVFSWVYFTPAASSIRLDAMFAMVSLYLSDR